MPADMELSPLRSLDDFLLGSARFQLPNYKDLEKWGNRVVHNLLYYQTNYFLMAFIMIVTVTVLHPLQMFYGFLNLAVIYGIFSYYVVSKRSTTRSKQGSPLLGICIITGGACVFVYLLGSLLVFLFGILLPFCSIFVHASLRLRNIKNKLSSIERVVSNRTPMGAFLETIGMEPELIS